MTPRMRFESLQHWLVQSLILYYRLSVATRFAYKRLIVISPQSLFIVIVFFTKNMYRNDAFNTVRPQAILQLMSDIGIPDDVYNKSCKVRVRLFIHQLVTIALRLPIDMSISQYKISRSPSIIGGVPVKMRAPFRPTRLTWPKTQECTNNAHIKWIDDDDVTTVRGAPYPSVAAVRLAFNGRDWENVPGGGDPVDDRSSECVSVCGYSYHTKTEEYPTLMMVRNPYR